MSPSFRSLIFACGLVLSFSVVSDSARILGLFITPCKSHLIIHSAIMSALAERGHNVTIISSVPLVTPNPRYRHIQLKIESLKSDFFSKLINEDQPWYQKLYDHMQVTKSYMSAGFKDPQIKKLMDEESFDLIIHGYFFNEFQLGLQAHFKCPGIISMPVRPVGAINGLVGNPHEVAYVPSLLSGDKQPLGFVERLKNFMYINILEELLMAKIYHWNQLDFYKVPEMCLTWKLFFFCAFLSTFWVTGYGARILGLFPTHGKSHLIVHTAVADALAKHGHDVTVVTTIPLPRPKHHFRHVQLNITGIPSNFYSNRINQTPPWYTHLPQIIQMITEYANRSLNTFDMKKLMQEESFDLVIQGYLANEFLLGVAAHFKCPVVMSLMVRPIDSVNVLVGNPMELVYVPSLIGGGKQPMGFLSRLRNLFYVIFVEKLVVSYFYQWYQKEAYLSNFPPDKYPSFDEVKKNVSLILTNHHFSQTPIRPNVPAMVEIGGIQIKEKPDPLPEDIRGIMDNSTKHGVIYFSLGSNVEGRFLNSTKVKIFFDVLSKLPQTVLWKWGDSKKPGKSPNIIYKSWLPQDDVLHHRNVKLFVTHGGQGSVVESEYHGVPMVGIPLFGEQSSNIENVVKEGFGLSVDYKTMTYDDFDNAIQEVLTNKKYIENVRRFAKLYKDRPMTAKETAVFWVEYVLRHHGAPHMQSPAVHLNIFQLLSLDVIGFLLGVLYICYKVIKIVFSLILGLCRSKKSKTE